MDSNTARICGATQILNPFRQSNDNNCTTHQIPMATPACYVETLAKFQGFPLARPLQNPAGTDGRGTKIVPFRPERGRDRAKRGRRGMQVGTRGRMDSTICPGFATVSLAGEMSGFCLPHTADHLFAKALSFRPKPRHSGETRNPQGIGFARIMRRFELKWV